MVLCAQNFVLRLRQRLNSRHSTLLNFRNFLLCCNFNCLIIRRANVFSYKTIDDRARRDCCDNFLSDLLHHTGQRNFYMNWDKTSKETKNLILI